MYSIYNSTFQYSDISFNAKAVLYDFVHALHLNNMHANKMVFPKWKKKKTRELGASLHKNRNNGSSSSSNRKTNHRSNKEQGNICNKINKFICICYLYAHLKERCVCIATGSKPVNMRHENVNAEIPLTWNWMCVYGVCVFVCRPNDGKWTMYVHYTVNLFGFGCWVLELRVLAHS